ncbi:NAD(P)/FAD-dependent oxidoreductase, partial [Escherichia coli]|nr:NAD(P)/FAD-dependent oxidoreductase [Escherichia coli]
MEDTAAPKAAPSANEDGGSARFCRTAPRIIRPMQQFDVVIVGAGAAGLFCAGVAGQLGLKVLVLDHAKKIAEKIRISGGGRCNFT